MNEPSTWKPSDDELDALARSLEPLAPAPAKLESNRVAILAASAEIRQGRPRSRAVIAVAIACPLLAAAGLVLWMARGSAGDEGDRSRVAVTVPVAPAVDAAAPVATSFATVTARGAADFDDPGESADRLVALRDGELLVEVANLATDQLFRVRAGEAEIEAFHAKFSAAAAREKLVAVVVYEGRIELRIAGAAPRALVAGERWQAPTKTAAAAVVPKDTRIEPKRPRIEAPKPPEERVAAPKPAGPGEDDFRRGWAALRAKKHAAAATAFDASCRAASSQAIGEDACFWAAVAAKRAGRAGLARRHLSRFLGRYPSSSRAGEASALLGWLLFDADQLENAERRFRAALGDSVPTVKQSAQKGLAAIKARRNPNPK